MGRFTKNIALIGFIISFNFSSLFAESREPQFAVGINVLETAGVMLANEIFWEGHKGLTLIPIHLNAQWRIFPHFSLDLGFIYRYENYHKEKKIIDWNAGEPVYESQFGGEIDGKPIWVNYHELFFLAGPRYNFNPNGLSGFYVSLPIGTGFAFSPNYFAWSFLAQPEVGYSWNFGVPGFYLATGAAILFNIPIYEKPDITPIVGRLLGARYLNPIHHAIPIINLTLGMAF